MGGCGRGQPGKRVTAFQHGDHPPVAAFRSDLENGAGERGEILVLEAEEAQRVADSRVESRREKNQLRAELADRRKEGVEKRANDLLSTRTGAEGAVD